MITNKLDGVVSLLKTNNFAIVEELLNANLIAPELIYDAIKIMKKNMDVTCGRAIFAALVEKLDTFDDQEVIDIMIDSLSHSFTDSGEIMSSFMKLVDLGGKLDMWRIMDIPYNAFIYYTSKNNYIADEVSLFCLVAGYVQPKSKMAAKLWQKMETDILLIKDFDIIECMVTSIVGHVDAPLLINEVLSRNLLDIVFLNLIKTYGARADYHSFFAEYLSMCNNVREIAFYMSCSIAAECHRCDEDCVQPDFFKLVIFITQNLSAIETFRQISTYKISHTDADVQFITPKIAELIQEYQNAYPDLDDHLIMPNFSPLLKN